MGLSDSLTHRERQFTGQAHFQGERGKQEIHGIRMRDLADCFVRAVCLSASHVAPEAYARADARDGTLNYNDVYGFDLDQLDPHAIMQNLCCEVEREMGIYPNLPKGEDNA